jgi:hypothetical protein
VLASNRTSGCYEAKTHDAGLHGLDTVLEKDIDVPKVSLVFRYKVGHGGKVVTGAKCNRGQVVQEEKQVVSHKTDKRVLVESAE